MLTCPQCKKTVARLERQCPSCRTDLGLLVDFVAHLQTGLERAEAQTRAGELGDAVWEYLQVLEVDPDNPIARRQVGRVVTAVRQFDQTAPGRRWLAKARRRERFRRWLDSNLGASEISRRWTLTLLFVLLLVVAVLGFWGGFAVGRQHPAETAGEVADE